MTTMSAMRTITGSVRCSRELAIPLIYATALYTPGCTMDYNPETSGSASARFFLAMAMGILLMVIMLSILADLVTGAGMVDRLMSAMDAGILPSMAA